MEEKTAKQKSYFSLKNILATPEKAFLTLAITFGLLFLLVIPPFQVPDEPAHFFRVYQVSEGRLMAERKDNVAGGWVPASLVNTMSVWCDRIPFRPTEKVRGEQFSKSVRMPLERDNLTYAAFMSSAYSPIPYLPQVIGINIGKFLNLPPVFILYLGRFTNLIVTTIIAFCAIKIIAGYKWIFFLLALTPMAINQRASLSADALLNSVSFLIIAIIANFACNPKKEKIFDRDVYLMAFLGIVLSLSKQVYFLLPFLCFMIPREKFGSSTKYWRSCLLIVGVNIIAWVAWSTAMKDLVGIPVNPLVDASVERQTQYLLANPFTGISTAWNSLQDIEHVLREFIGFLGWLDTRIPAIVTIPYQYMLLIVGLISSQSNFIISKVRKKIIFGVFSGTIFLIYLSQYMIWTPVGAMAVDGVQGRYLIPASPLFFLLLDNKRFSLKISEQGLRSLIVYFSIFALTLSLIAIIDRFY
jgi:uncharacterized membrane protein